MPFWLDDIDGYYLDWGEDAVWTPAGGEATPITVIFDPEVMIILDGMQTTAPQVTCKSSEVVGMQRRDTMVYNETTYFVLLPGKDVHGIREVTLSED